ncbi:MAG: aminopeptidase N C-terminal domain-containing protein [Acidimicrobiales bacterium]|nr:aminopeptidase N C-terminal domain-containing protein [Acidimicrobiales bacterium]MCB9394169.1 aminopeptidase N C-terminal domain-containing protein [Acidimicrobiaceae bacterium]
MGAAAGGWRSEHVELRVELDAHEVVVSATTRVERIGDHGDPLVLDGRGLDTLEVAVDGRVLDGTGYALDDRTLTLPLAGPRHDVRTVVSVRPGGAGDKGVASRPRLISTNCEPEGFRRITWAIDRPANRSTFDVTLVADPRAHRTLLANGDLVEAGTLADGRHWARFVDPVTKPSYLFAFVAGDLDIAAAPHTTRSGRTIMLQVAALPEQIGGAAFALRTLSSAMSFDESMGGVEHDLDTLTFVALPGYPDATEYHGLMFFDSSLLVVETRGSSDDDLLLIMANIAHEYGHHVRGNRVTVSSWGQLALKEGLTVLMGQNDTRRHWFGPVGRVLDVLDLRRLQFPEEVTIGAPVVRGEVPNPESLYTRTTYLKGAEVFGMLRTLLGPEAWASAFATFVAHHDLAAASVDDAVAVMRDECPGLAGDVDGIARWFALAGRPSVSMAQSVDGDVTRIRILRTDALTDDPPVAMPVVLGFRGDDGRPVPVEIAGASSPVHTVVIRDRDTTVEVAPGRPLVIAPLLGYSAPVDLTTDHDAEQLAVLAAHEDDAFARWWAAQELMTRAVDASRAGEPDGVERHVRLLVGALRHVIDDGVEPMLLAQLLTLPDEFALGDREPQIDVDGVAAGLAAVRERLGVALHDDLLGVLDRWSDDTAAGTAPSDIARRSLVEPCLALLLASGTDDAMAIAEAQLRHTDHTRAVRALAQLMHLDTVPAEQVDAWLAETHARWQAAPKLLDRWLRAQSGGRRADTIERVRAVRESPLYDRSERGRIMGLWFPFATRNRSVFHRPDGAGYRLFVDEVIELMPINAGVVIRLVGDLLQFRRFDERRRALLRAELERMAAAPGMPDFAVGIVRGLLDT